MLETPKSKSGSTSAATDPSSSTPAGMKEKGKAMCKKQKKSPWSDATLQLVAALQRLVPTEQMLKPKPSFKMAKVIAAPLDKRDSSAAWGGDCGLFNDVSQEVRLRTRLSA